VYFVFFAVIHPKNPLLPGTARLISDFFLLPSSFLLPGMATPRVNKLVLAVHGIGDQTRNSTILSTAAQFCHNFGYRALLPLGGFADTLQNGAPPFVIMETAPSHPGPLNTIGFAEIYWADLARQIATAGYTLQETKEWCRSVVSRVRVLAERREPGRTDIHYDQIEYVLDEAIDAIGVMESLLFLARKAGVLDFDLKQMLDDYLGDVQLVTEFNGIRAKILDRLHDAFANAHALYPQAEIYVVAHSEGTVVAFLGLLQAVTDPRQYPWIKQVRGLMTIGSPIDKHLILWPDLFTPFSGPDTLALFGQLPSDQPRPAPPIRWLNYVDNGDPVGFELDTARWWMTTHGYDQVFEFTENDDFYFTRYFVPGKAHTDYWNDADVFQHFIMTVVAPPQAPSDAPSSERRQELANGPRQLVWARITSYVVAYLIPLAAIFAAVYFLCKGVEGYLDPKGDFDHPHLIRNVFALGGLLAGATIWLRLTQLVRFGLWHIVGFAIYLACAGLFYFAVVRTDDLAWFNTLPNSLGDRWTDPRQGLVLLSAALVFLVMLSNARWLRRVWADSVAPVFRHLFAKKPVLGVSTTLPTPGSTPSRSSEAKSESAASHRPLVRNALRSMLITGGVALVLNTAWYAHLYHPAKAPLWPIVLGGAAFLYLWRLASLIFDLVFIWHRYIRFSGAMTFLRRSILPAAAAEAPGASGGKT